MPTTERMSNEKKQMMIYHGVQQTTNAPRMNVIVRRAFRARFCDLDFLRLFDFWLCNNSRRLDFAEFVPTGIIPVVLSVCTETRPFFISFGITIVSGTAVVVVVSVDFLTSICTIIL